MKLTMTTLAVLGLTGTMAFAEGDPAKGEAVFKKCQTCHVVADADGNVLAGKNAKTGPNLYGVVGRTAGTYDGFRYGDAIKAAGEKGLVWDEAQMVSYVQDPAGFLKTYLDDKKAKSQMSFKLKKEQEAMDVVAYIASLAPAPEGEAAAPAPTN